MKLNEMKEKTVEELKELILEGKKELFSLRMKHTKMSPLENPAQIKKQRREIAQLKTVLRQKEVQA